MAGLPDFIEEIITSYEERLQSIGCIIDNTQIILGEFQESMSDTKRERVVLEAQLRETLARNESLRKKDFDAMMTSILLSQDNREKEVRRLLDNYLLEQREMAVTLRKNLGSSREELSSGNMDRIKEFHEILREIRNNQDQRRSEVTARLKAFQKEQSDLSCTFRDLLAKGRALRIRDLKTMLKQFRTQYGERAALRQERREDVQRMLQAFRKERRESTSP